MANTESSSREERIDVAFGAVRQLLMAIEVDSGNIPAIFRSYISKETIDQIVATTLCQHQDHLIEHGVQQNHVDPYKMVSWLGCAILRKIPCQKEDPDNICAYRVAARAIIKTLCGLLYKEKGLGLMLPEGTPKLLLKMLVAESSGRGGHGIWQNGLYCSFHCASKTIGFFAPLLQKPEEGSAA